jgi:hypothetical protein
MSNPKSVVSALTPEALCDRLQPIGDVSDADLERAIRDGAEVDFGAESASACFSAPVRYAFIAFRIMPAIRRQWDLTRIAGLVKRVTASGESVPVTKARISQLKGGFVWWTEKAKLPAPDASDPSRCRLFLDCVGNKRADVQSALGLDADGNVADPTAKPQTGNNGKQPMSWSRASAQLKRAIDAAFSVVENGALVSQAEIHAVIQRFLTAAVQKRHTSLQIAQAQQPQPAPTIAAA